MTDKTLLLRQIHEVHIQQDRITSGAFKPTKKDNGLLSTYNGDMISPEDSYIHYTIEQKMESEGVAGVTVEECTKVELTVDHDGFEFPEHVSINFSKCGGSTIKRNAKSLASVANARDWLYLSDKDE